MPSRFGSLLLNKRDQNQLNHLLAARPDLGRPVYEAIAIPVGEEKLARRHMFGECGVLLFTKRTTVRSNALLMVKYFYRAEGRSNIDGLSKILERYGIIVTLVNDVTIGLNLGLTP